MKEKVLFRSKEYGVGGHNKLELRILDDGSVRLWIHDGDCHALICMDQEDTLSLATNLRRAGKTVPESVECMDFTKPLRHKAVTTSEAKGVKKRKPRSDKGKKRGPRKKEANGNQ